MDNTIITGNKLIAEFMDARNHTALPDLYWFEITPTEDSSHQWNLRAMQYHTSWDWLMPVVEKIVGYDGPFRMVIGNVNSYTHFDAYDKKITDPSALKSTWLTVVKYIQWYNTSLTNK